MRWKSWIVLTAGVLLAVFALGIWFYILNPLEKLLPEPPQDTPATSTSETSGHYVPSDFQFALV